MCPVGCGEFARHEAVTEAIGLDVSVCDPHSPWQRGWIKNANGLLRRDLPRNTALADCSGADVDDAPWNLNATPPKCLGYRIPAEAFAAAGRNSASFVCDCRDKPSKRHDTG